MNERALTLAKMTGRKGFIVTLMITVSFIFNVLALFTPFTTVGSLFSSYSCTLPYSVYLMWTEGLYLIAILIAGFSIMFPFVKLFFLVRVWVFEKNESKRVKIIKYVEPLGKWSMLDVFATCIILILCNKQILIYGSPMIGVNFFMGAIFLSIISSLTIDHINLKSSAKISPVKQPSLTYSILAVCGFFLSFIILISAVFYPYLKITSFLLIGYSYSVVSSVATLTDVSIILSVFMFLTMIIFPLLHNGALLLFWILKIFKRRDEFPKLRNLIRIFSRFNMLDVFILAFIIFLSEGEAMVEIENRPGIVLIGAFIFIVLVLPRVASAIRSELFSIKNKELNLNIENPKNFKIKNKL